MTNRQSLIKQQLVAGLATAVLPRMRNGIRECGHKWKMPGGYFVCCA